VIWHVLTLALFGLFGMLTFVVVAVMRQLGSLVLLINPDFPRDVPGGLTAGTEVAVDGLEPGHPAVVLFLGPACTACAELEPRIPVAMRQFPDVAFFGIVGQADTPAGEELAARVGDIARTDLPALEKEWSIPGTPFGVAISPNHRVVAQGIVNTLDQLTSMAEHARIEFPEDVPEEDTPERELADLASVDSVPSGAR
jgi:hypothetical protein